MNHDPCLGCTMRHIGCQSKCPEYWAREKELAARKEYLKSEAERGYVMERQLSKMMPYDGRKRR